jgi:hypothetical protein
MWKVGLGLFSLLAYFTLSVNAGATTQEPQNSNCTRGEYCFDKTCELPNCRCSGDDPTYDSDYVVASMPQIIYLTYDDGFTSIAESQFYRGLFDGTYKNPDGNAIRATHFLTHSYTDYELVNNYWRELGHEMASHSVTHRTNQDYWKGINEDGWTAEALGMRKAITQFANIPAQFIEGFRSPYLQMGGDEMFAALANSGFKYDCSWASREYGFQHLDAGLYPYTMDFESIQDCEIGPCPECDYPGFWVQPMLDLEDNWFDSNPIHPDWGQPCSMLDGCIFIDEQTEEAVHDMLMRNFNKVYNGNRAPFGLYMHAAWFFGDQAWHYEGYKSFLKDITDNYDDVWIVPVGEGIDYYSNHFGTTNEELLAMGDDSPFGLAAKLKEREGYPCDALDPCSYKVTNEDINNQERYMQICGRVGPTKQRCPNEYPWLTKPCGGNRPCA